MNTQAPGRIRIASLYEDLSASMAALRKQHHAVDSSRQVVLRALEDGRAHYGINTGFGILANKRIDAGQLAELQRNILLSHACGVGEPVPPEITRLMLQLKIHALGLGQSGISRTTFNQLLAFEHKALLAWIPSRGSVGASGDLAPLAHMCLPLIGRGEVWNDERNGKLDALTAMKEKGIEPIQLKAKDGLALINGTQLMAAYGAFVLERSLTLLKAADIISAMSLEALQGSATPFDARIHQIRPHPGQSHVASNIRQLLEESEILDSHRDCGKVQDPYSLRCIPRCTVPAVMLSLTRRVWLKLSLTQSLTTLWFSRTETFSLEETFMGSRWHCVWTLQRLPWQNWPAFQNAAPTSCSRGTMAFQNC